MPDKTDPISHLGQSSFFTRLSQTIARYAGKPATSFIALSVVIVWALSGPLFGFNDTWQLVINTSTTIITFLMVFVIQNSQNRDTAAMQIKLDELLSKVEGAREELMDLEELDEEKLAAIRDEYERRARRARDKPECDMPGISSGRIDDAEAARE
ncbi:low affinity iron permease family protein [Boseaceae bacterium BT-24-1]|nr:low affinity iron permease family protein [Boseaceae bacterium BT-24-1]